MKKNIGRKAKQALDPRALIFGTNITKIFGPIPGQHHIPRTLINYRLN